MRPHTTPIFAGTLIAACLFFCSSCANPSRSPMQQAMADTARANAAAGLSPAGAPMRGAGIKQTTGMQDFFNGRSPR